MGRPDCRERLRTLIASMDDGLLTEVYVRMVQSRKYQPIDVIGPGLWRELRDYEDEDEVLQRIGEICRGCLGIGGA